MKCPTIEKWRNQKGKDGKSYILIMSIEKLAKHWKKCKICQVNLRKIKGVKDEMSNL